MNFKLNSYDKIKNPVTEEKGNRTIAKEKLYMYIQEKIEEIHPNFNIKCSTSSRGYNNPHWESPYEHWLFVSRK